MGVGLASEFLRWIDPVVAASGLKTTVSQSVRPSFASRHIACKVTSPCPGSPTAEVRYSRPFDNTGDDHPFPPSSTFHVTPSVALHFCGTFVAAEIPCPPAPRNCGHSVSAAKALVAARMMERKVVRAVIPSELAERAEEWKRYESSRTTVNIRATPWSYPPRTRAPLHPHSSACICDSESTT